MNELIRSRCKDTDSNYTPCVPPVTSARQRQVHRPRVRCLASSDRQATAISLVMIDAKIGVLLIRGINAHANRAIEVIMCARHAVTYRLLPLQKKYKRAPRRCHPLPRTCYWLQKHYDGPHESSPLFALAHYSLPSPPSFSSQHSRASRVPRPCTGTLLLHTHTGVQKYDSIAALIKPPRWQIDILPHTYFLSPQCRSAHSDSFSRLHAQRGAPACCGRVELRLACKKVIVYAGWVIGIGAWAYSLVKIAQVLVLVGLRVLVWFATGLNLSDRHRQCGLGKIRGKECFTNFKQSIHPLSLRLNNLVCWDIDLVLDKLLTAKRYSAVANCLLLARQAPENLDPTGLWSALSK